MSRGPAGPLRLAAMLPLLATGCGEPPFVLDAVIDAPESHELSIDGRPLESGPAGDGRIVVALKRTWHDQDAAIDASPLDITCESGTDCGPYALPVTACRRYDTLGRILELDADYHIDARDRLAITAWTCHGTDGDITGTAARTRPSR